MAIQRADTEQEIRHLMNLADELQANLDDELTRASLVRLVAVAGVIVTGIAVMIVVVVSGTVGPAWTISAGAVAVAIVGWLTQTLFSRPLARPLTRRARRDERALSEVVRILRESVGAIEQQGDWSAFKRAEVQVRLARYQDTGDPVVGMRELTHGERTQPEKWGPDIARHLTQAAAYELDLMLVDPKKASVPSWMSLPEFFGRRGRVRLLLPDLRNERVRAQVEEWFELDVRADAQMQSFEVSLDELRIRGGADPEQCEVRISALVFSLDIMLADNATGAIGFPTAGGGPGLIVTQSAPLIAMLSANFRRAWEAARPAPIIMR